MKHNKIDDFGEGLIEGVVGAAKAGFELVEKGAEVGEQLLSPEPKHRDEWSRDGESPLGTLPRTVAHAEIAAHSVRMSRY